MGEMTMVERVARAICHQNCRGGVVHICDQEVSSGRCKPASCRYWPMEAPAAADAIRAMRDPDLAMRKVCTFEEAEVTWPAMIDAALVKATGGEG